MSEQDENKQSTTTTEEDRHTAARRQINRIWETTQAVISVLVVLTTCAGVFVGRIVEGAKVTLPFPPEWWTVVGLVIGFYFGRTNHQRPGGQ